MRLDAFAACVTAACWRGPAPAPSSPAGQWRAFDDSPPAARELPHRDEVAPGRSDDATGIHGFCPPKLVVFALGGGRELAMGEPCSGPTVILLRVSGTGQPFDNALYGAGGTWHAFALPGERALVAHQGGGTILFVADLASRRLVRLGLPRELARSSNLAVSVDGDRVFVGGGDLLVSRGGGGPEGVRPANQGCDPIAFTEQVPNERAFVLRSPPDLGTPRREISAAGCALYKPVRCACRARGGR